MRPTKENDEVVKQEMNVFRHHDIAEDMEFIYETYAFKSFEKCQIAHGGARSGWRR